MADNQSPSQLVKELRGEQCHRWREGDRVPVEAYLQRHAALQADGANVLQLVYQEILLREESGETPQLAEYLERFPQFASQLTPLFEVHQALEMGSLLAANDTEASRPTTPAEDAGTATPERPVIPGYEILSELGRGGMGVVYKAWQRSLNRVVALKVVLAGAHAGPEARARFRAEAEAVARLQHAHIVQIHEVGEAAGCPYFSLEFVDGGNLAHQVAGKPQPVQPAARLMETLARTVHYAHQQGIVHRDLKPANVLLTGASVPKITDFGLAKQLDQGSGLPASGPTRSGVILGTPNYMAPEQAIGKTKLIGPAADIHALGAILYEMLTGRPPFLGETPLDTLQQVQFQEPVPVRRLQPKVPRDVETICLKCLHKEVQRRYASAEALADDLHRFLAGQPIQARPVGAVERLWRWGLRNPALAAAGGLAATALVGVVALSITFGLYKAQAAADLRLKQQQAQTAQEEAETQRTLALDNWHQAELQAAHSYMLHGLSRCNQGEVGHGLLWLARSLEIATKEGDRDLASTLRFQLAGWSRQLHTLRARLRLPADSKQVDLSPDGRTLLTGGRDGTVQRWDAVTGQPLGPPLRHRDEVLVAAFSPDGRLIVTGSKDRTACLWDATTGQPFGPPLLHPDQVRAAALSPDGRTVLTGCADRNARLWEAATGKPIGPSLSHPGTVRSVMFSPDGRSVLTLGASQTVQLWEAATGKPSGAPLRHDGFIWSAAFHPNGRMLLTGSSDRTARLWEVATGKPIGPPLVHGNEVRAVAFSPDGRFILTGCQDQTARLWDTASHHLVGSPLRHQRYVHTVAFNPDGRLALTGSGDQTARLWDTATGKPYGVPLHHPGPVQRVVFSSDGRTLLTVSASSPGPPWSWAKIVHVWDSARDQVREMPLGKPGQALAVAFSPDGRTILTGYSLGTADLNTPAGEAQLRDAATGKVLWTIPHRAPVHAVAFSPDGRMIVTGSLIWDAGKGNITPGNGRAQLWDAATGQPLGPPLALEDTVRAVAFSPDGRILLTASSKGTLKLWDVATRQLIGGPLSHRTVIWAATFSPDGQTVLSGSSDNTAQLWSAATDQLPLLAVRHEDRINAVAFPPGGRVFVTGSSDGTAQLWDSTTGHRRGPPLQHPDGVRAVAFSPDGKTILTGCVDHKARLWETATGRPIGPPLAHPDQVFAVALSPNGRFMMTGCRDGTVRLWETFTPLEGTVERIVRWTQVITDMELDRNHELRRLDVPTWQQRFQQLQELGGPLPP
jgi:WD40 repeat protein